MSEHVVTLATISLERDGETSIVRIDGELDVSNIGEVQDLLEKHLSNDLVTIYVVLDDVGFADSSALSLFLSLHRALKERQQTLIFVLRKDHRLWHVLEIMGLDQVLVIQERLAPS